MSARRRREGPPQRGKGATSGHDLAAAWIYSTASSRGTATQPFDDGALTLGWTCTPVKGRVAAPLHLSPGHHGRLPLLHIFRCHCGPSKRREEDRERGGEPVESFLRWPLTTPLRLPTPVAAATAGHALAGVALREKGEGRNELGFGELVAGHWF
jgi:hypothetical protein